MIVRVGFKYNGKHLLGFEIKTKLQGDVYVLVFEGGHRRQHVSYHKDGRVNHNADRPNAKHMPAMWDIWGEMEPMIRYDTPVKDVVGRKRVAGTGWATEDIEKAALPEFVPHADDIVVEPTTPTVGFSVNIISPGTPAREIGDLRLPVLSRHERGTAPTVEIETFDWLAPQVAGKILMTTIRMIVPNNEGAWLLDDNEQFNTCQEAAGAAVAQYGVPHRCSARNDGGVNLYYYHLEDDSYSI
jgi:hypothetical protein